MVHCRARDHLIGGHEYRDERTARNTDDDRDRHEQVDVRRIDVAR